VEFDDQRLHHLAEHGADLVVGDWQDPLAGVDDSHFVQPQHLEEAGVLAADGAAPRDHQRSGEPLHVLDRVRVVHARPGERDRGGAVRRGAGRDEYDAGLE
jgi:hypothetical protein